MALVLLPCDLPTWPTLQRHLTQLRSAQTTTQVLEGMMAIYHLCNISLDPDDDKLDLTVFDGLVAFLDQQCSPAERQQFFETILPTMAEFALRLKMYKPLHGLQYSLQQHSDHVILQRGFVASLIAHAFFCTFPRRTLKTHPTLQDFTFTQFFHCLIDSAAQQQKLRSLFRYFEWLHQRSADDIHLSETLTVCRQVMSSKEWLTLGDWTTSRRPLCPVLVHHEGRIEDAEEGTCQVCFASSHIGGQVLQHGLSQECLQLTRNPELLACTLPYVEALQDNEALTIHGHRTFHSGPVSQSLEGSNHTSCICIDAEDYSDCPIRQFEEDEILRELNKAFTGFRQNGTPQKEKVTTPTVSTPCSQNVTRSTTLCESNSTDSQTQTSQASVDRRRLARASLLGSAWQRTSDQTTTGSGRKVGLEPSLSTTLLYGGGRTEPLGLDHCVQKPTNVEASNSKSAESRNSAGHRQDSSSDYTSCHSSSNNTSFDSAESHPAPVAASTADSDERLRRSCSSRGFALEDEFHEDDGFSGDGLEREREWLRYFRDRRSRSRSASQRERDSSRYSFSSEFSSELDEMYDQFSHWLEDPDSKELRPRDLALFRFAHNMLKRTLSDSFANIALSIENLPASGCKSSQIKLGSFAQPNNQVSKPGLRSQSLSEAMYQHERLALQVAKEILTKDMPQIQRPEHVPEQPVSLPTSSVSNATSVSSPAEPLTSIPAVQLTCLDPNDTLDTSKMAVPIRSQASVAWEYHQDPFCEFVITVPPKPKAKLTPPTNPDTEWVVEATVYIKRAFDVGKLTRAESLKALAFLRSRTWTREESTAHLNNLKSLSVIFDSVTEDKELLMPSQVHLVPQSETGRPNSTVPPLISSPGTEDSLRTTQAQSPPKLNSGYQKPVNVVLLDRMTSLSSADDPTNLTKKLLDSNSSQDSSLEPTNMTPSQPTPPRTRRGSWLVRSTKLRHSKSKATKNTPPQRARSNSVPAVMEFAQLALSCNNPNVPDIIISPSADTGSKTETSPFFPSSLLHRRHHSIDTINLQASTESLLNNDVVEGFSYTMAEKIVEDVVREWPMSTSNPNLLTPETLGNPFFPAKAPLSVTRKGILKNKSNDSLYRSHSGSLDFSVEEVDERAESPSGLHTPDAKVSTAQRSTSMPSLQNLDPDKPPSLATNSSSVATGKLVNLNSDGPRPLVTGNWGCGKRSGDPQLKAMIQWLAASQCDAPCLVYYTFEHPQMVKFDIVCRLILDRKWTVGDLAQAVLRHCQAHLHSTSLLGLVDLIACDSSAEVGLFPSSQAHKGAKERSADQKCLFDELMGTERASQFMETEL